MCAYASTDARERGVAVDMRECADPTGLMVALDELVRMEGKGKQDKGVILVTNGRSRFDSENGDPGDGDLIDMLTRQIIDKELRLTVM
jgi:hypothetical protein